MIKYFIEIHMYTCQIKISTTDTYVNPVNARVGFGFTDVAIDDFCVCFVCWVFSWIVWFLLHIDRKRV